MKKILSISLVFILLITSFIEVNATETTITTEGDQNISVIADVSAVFEVTVPSSISITDFDTTEFDIKGTGNISKYEYLSISIPNTVKMECEGEYSENLPITTSSDRFLREELMSNDGGTISCSIDSSTLPSGSWIGSLDINISIKDLYYRLPDTVTYYQYVTVFKRSSGNIEIWTTQKPMYYKHYSGQSPYLENDESWNDCIQYIVYPDGTIKTNSSGQFGGRDIYLDGSIIYCNYDIRYGNASGEIWLEKQCPD